MSDEVYPGFTYSTCSYVCSLLRPEIFRFLDLPRHGLQVIPYEINSQPNAERRGHRHLSRPRPHAGIAAPAFDQGCRGLRSLRRRDQPAMPLHQAAADDDAARSRRCSIPSPRTGSIPGASASDLDGLLQDRRRVRAHGREADVRDHPLLDHVDRRFPRRVFRACALEGILGRLRHHRHGARPLLARHCLCAAASLHGRGRRPDRRLGLRPRRHGQRQQGDRLGRHRSRRGNPHRCRCGEDHRAGRQGHRRGARRWRGDLCQDDRLQSRSEAHLSEAAGEDPISMPSIPTSIAMPGTSRSAAPRAS